jgi:hypothetical protein
MHVERVQKPLASTVVAARERFDIGLSEPAQVRYDEAYHPPRPKDPARFLQKYCRIVLGEVLEEVARVHDI